MNIHTYTQKHIPGIQENLELLKIIKQQTKLFWIHFSQKRYKHKYNDFRTLTIGKYLDESK